MFVVDEINLPLLGKVFAVPEWKGRYLAHYRDALDRIYDWQTLGAKIAQYQKFIEKELATDTKKLYSMHQKFRTENEEMKKEILSEIQSGAFAHEWLAQAKEGAPFLLDQRSEGRKHQIEKVGSDLRGMMPFLDPKAADDS